MKIKDLFQLYLEKDFNNFSLTSFLILTQTYLTADIVGRAVGCRNINVRKRLLRKIRSSKKLLIFELFRLYIHTDKQQFLL